MNTPDLEPFWRVCERAWGAWLASNRWTVTHLYSNVHNGAGTGAPMMALSNGAWVTTPDYLSMRAGQTRYWEVKSRVRPLTDAMTGVHWHWISSENYQAYRAVAQDTGCPLTIVVCEGATAYTSYRWLSIEVNNISDHAIVRTLPRENGTQQEVVCWPVSAMIPIDGPDISNIRIENPLFNSVDEQSIPLSAAVMLAGELRRKKSAPVEVRPSEDVSETIQIEPQAPNHPTTQMFEQDAFAELDALRISLGIPVLPRYSVLCISPKVQEDYLELLRYGIRVFLITNAEQQFNMPPEELRAFREARLLEWASISSLTEHHDVYAVDGIVQGDTPDWFNDILHQADLVGGFNALQYHIVHASQDQDILVTAGAGTGKTETMAERLMYLLSTVSSANSFNANYSNNELLLSEIALVTFTKEAAREMRSRIARTLVLRRRLCPYNVHPVMAWIIQLGSAHISTIHSFAKRIIKTYGMLLGISQSFRVSTQKHQFHDFLHDGLSQHIVDFLNAHPEAENIPEYKWVKFIEKIWEGLENNGVPLIEFSDVGKQENGAVIDWGTSTGDSVNVHIAEIVRKTIEEMRRIFAEHCRREQAIPTNQLVPTAHAAVERLSEPPNKRFRFIFVDEFQDTDPLQMQMILTLRQRLNAQLFVVGDPKQGIYRFRGAEGNAFDVLRKSVAARKMTAFTEFTLTLNFRTDGVLLNSMHPYFASWGERDYLMYDKADRLRPNPMVASQGASLEKMSLSNKTNYGRYAAANVQSWREQDSSASIAVLCRTNEHAKHVQQAIRQSGGQCDLLVGGDFYLTPAVRELRVFLEAVVNPDDDAALVELCETRWSGRLFLADTPSPTTEQAAAWGNEVIVPYSWVRRLGAGLNATDFPRSDLASLRKRVEVLRTVAKRMSGMSFIVEMQKHLQPEICSLSQLDDETERQRYVRCFTHLLTLMDAQFADSHATLISILEWVRLQIGVNRQEDEPVDVQAMQGKTTALTVHKSKGLEFDFVILPNTWKTFDRPANATHIVTVLQNDDGSRSVLWKWRPVGKSYTNVEELDNRWFIDSKETHREETRLLYVSMTRARKKLKIMVNPRANVNSWSGLLT